MFQMIVLSIVLFFAFSIVVFFLMIKVIDFNEYKPRIQKAIKENTKVAFSYLRDIDSGKMHHYYFLPQAAYLDNDIKSKGLIVDLLEIKNVFLYNFHPFLKKIRIQYRRLHFLYYHHFLGLQGN